MPHDCRRIGILSRDPTTYSTRRLAEAAEATGMDVSVLDPFGFSLQSRIDGAHLDYLGGPCPPLDAILPRIGAGTHASGLAVVRHWEARGVPSLNSSSAMEACRDKFRCIQALSAQGIPVPPTALTLREEDVLSSIRDIGGVPAVLKILESGQGRGVFLARTEYEAVNLVRSFHDDGRFVLIQKFVAESRGTDLRALVVGEEVVAAMRRTAATGEFRSNVHLGGDAQAVTLSPDQASLAVRAVRGLGLKAAGVDIVQSAEGPLVLEANASPGLEGIEEVTGVDIAALLIAHLAAVAKSSC